LRFGPGNTGCIGTQPYSFLAIGWLVCQYLVCQQVAQCSQVNDSPPGMLVILSQLQQECGSMQVEVTSHFHKDLKKVVCVTASNAAQRLHSLVKTTHTNTQ